MSTTPSPSKRPRIPTSTTVSNTNSPFPAGGPPTRPHAGPRSVGSSGTAAGMSPADAFSPAPVDSYGMTGFTPYSTTSPAYIAGGAGTAASPISAALAHGSRILSNIQAGSPFYNAGPTPMPMMAPPPQGYPNRMMGGQIQQPRPPATPQQGSPEYLALALQHLQTTVLARLEADAEGFFDAVGSALAVSADTRHIEAKAGSFKNALENVLAYLEKNGLASIPLLPLPESAGESTSQPKDAVTTISAETVTAAARTETTDPTAPAAKLADASQTKSDQENKKDDASTSKTTAQTLEQHITQLQAQAKELFDRRQRLKESASIVTGILDS